MLRITAREIAPLVVTCIAVSLEHVDADIEIMANGWGKTKMIFQSVGVGLLLLHALLNIPVLVPIAEEIFYVSMGFAIVSAITYGI